MKNKHILKISFQDFSDFKKEVRGALAAKKTLIQPKNQIVFDTIASFRKFMTIQKIELLTIIATRKPSSIYELAKFADRDFAAVLRDAMSLEETGFIDLKETEDAKKSKTPLLVFDYFCIAIELPGSPYQIEFGLAS